MQDYLVKLKPKVVIFLVGINDLGIRGERDFDQRIHGVNFRSLERFLASAGGAQRTGHRRLEPVPLLFPQVSHD